MQGQDGQQGRGCQSLAIFNCSFPETLVQAPKAASSWEFGKLVPVRRLELLFLEGLKAIAPLPGLLLASGHGSGHQDFAGPLAGDILMV